MELLYIHDTLIGRRHHQNRIPPLCKSRKRCKRQGWGRIPAYWLKQERSMFDPYFT